MPKVISVKWWLAIIQRGEYSNQVANSLMDGDSIYASSQEMGLWWQPNPGHLPGPANTQPCKLGSNFTSLKHLFSVKYINTMNNTFIYVSSSSGGILSALFRRRVSSGSSLYDILSTQANSAKLKEVGGIWQKCSLSSTRGFKSPENSSCELGFRKRNQRKKRRPWKCTKFFLSFNVLYLSLQLQQSWVDVSKW